MPVSGAVAGLGAAAVKTSADFDSAMSQVAAVSGATGSDFDALRDKAREMGSLTVKKVGYREFSPNHCPGFRETPPTAWNLYESSWGSEGQSILKRKILIPVKWNQNCF